jgi:regulator of sigma E protease
VNILLAALAVSALIIVHEFGHFLLAKLVGMRVEIFSIGLLTKLVGVKVGETEYRLSVLPLGGYVKVSGESADESTGEPHEFWSKTPGQRALFIAGGMTMNLVLALVLFIVAFAIGVPFTVAEVGETFPGQPAWEAGLKPGDRILAVDDLQDPNFTDVVREVALSGGRHVTLKVEREGRMLTVGLEPRYDKAAGLRMIGVEPPYEPIVSGLAKIGGEEGVSPAQDAGIQIGDRILAVNGREVRTARDLMLELVNYPNAEIELLVERHGKAFTARVLTRPLPEYVIGISGVSTTVESLEGRGMAQEAGLSVGDRIAAVGGAQVNSVVELEEALRGSLGRATLRVDREGKELALPIALADRAAVAEFVFSALFESSTTLTWVRRDGPAWNAGVRPGDTVTQVAGRAVKTWMDIVAEGDRAGEDQHGIQWSRGGEVRSALVQPVRDASFSAGHLGAIFMADKKRNERYGALGAVGKGLVNTGRAVSEVLLMLRGFATRQVSTRHMGGILTIAVASYHAAREGIGKLLYLTAVISAAIAFLNVLPIPVLDGGHLLFLAIEKVRGRRLSQKVLTMAQRVGIVAVALLIVYVTRNDILRIVEWVTATAQR